MATVPDDQLRRFKPPNDWEQELRRGFRYAAGMYRLRDSLNDLLYIGIGADPTTRIKTHAKRAAWWPEVDIERSDVEWFREYTVADIAERVAIRLERPKYNMIHSRTRPHWSHARGGRPRTTPLADGDVISHADLRQQVAEVVTAVRVERSCIYVEGKHNPPAVAVVPIELGKLARRLGGPDMAARILVDYLQRHGATA